MTFEKFSQIWDKTVEEALENDYPFDNKNMYERTKEALRAYTRDNKNPMEILKKEFYSKYYN